VFDFLFCFCGVWVRGDIMGDEIGWDGMVDS
jgi:hypothetical protein